jgi:hypothetical protein
MDFVNRKWVIINVSDITDEMIENVIQISRDTLKKTLNGNKAILKWDGDTPSCFDGMITYNHVEILAELVKSDWVSN